MYKKKKWRYYCDFCKKAGGSAGAMAKHEKHCTNNPNRYCRLCDKFGESQQPMSELLSVLPNPNDYKTEKTDGIIGIMVSYDVKLQEVAKKALFTLNRWAETFNFLESSPSPRILSTS